MYAMICSNRLRTYVIIIVIRHVNSYAETYFKRTQITRLLSALPSELYTIRFRTFDVLVTMLLSDELHDEEQNMNALSIPDN